MGCGCQGGSSVYRANQKRHSVTEPRSVVNEPRLHVADPGRRTGPRLWSTTEQPPAEQK